jgi:hypothetical protein
MRRMLTAGLFITLVPACSPGPKESADAAAVPTEPGVCWRVRGGTPEVLDRVGNLPTCAQRLEAVRMMEGGGAVRGAFEGRTISVTEAAITQGKPGGERVAVFTVSQRREIQEAIQTLLDRRAEQERAEPRR